MPFFFDFDGLDGKIDHPQPQADTQSPQPSWGLDRIDQRNLPIEGADPFLAYGDGTEPEAGGFYTPKRLQIMYMFDEPEPASDLAVETPVEAGPFLLRAEFIYA